MIRNSWANPRGCTENDTKSLDLRQAILFMTVILRRYRLGCGPGDYVILRRKERLTATLYLPWVNITSGAKSQSVLELGWIFDDSYW